GKRDVPYDEGLPVPLGVAAELGGWERPLDGEITALNDQHAFLRHTGAQLAVGDVVTLGLSHPCTAFDKWRLIPVLDPATATVHEAVETFLWTCGGAGRCGGGGSAVARSSPPAGRCGPTYSSRVSGSPPSAASTRAVPGTRGFSRPTAAW